jgi:Flagellar capping protein
LHACRSTLEDPLSQTTGSFTINGVTITYDASVDSLNAIIQRINQSVPDVQAYYDPIADRVVLVSKTTGSNSIARADVSGNLLDVLGLLDSGNNARAQVSLGKDAIIRVSGFNNDQDIIRSSNTISDVIPGVTLQLIAADPTKPVTVTVGRDAEALKSAIKAFVDKFNAAVSLMYQRLTEKPVENPKTEAERKLGCCVGTALWSSSAQLWCGKSQPLLAVCLRSCKCWLKSASRSITTGHFPLTKRNSKRRSKLTLRKF